MEVPEKALDYVYDDEVKSASREDYLQRVRPRILEQIEIWDERGLQEDVIKADIAHQEVQHLDEQYLIDPQEIPDLR